MRSLPLARFPILFAVASAVGIAGCDPGQSSNPSGASDAPSSLHVVGAGSSQRQRQLDFMNQIRQSDPQYETIEKAVLNENNELGIILNRDVEVESIRSLTRAMLSQMTHEFPNQDLTLIAYAPSQPPVRIGIARLDARTGRMTYTSANAQ